MKRTAIVTVAGLGLMALNSWLLREHADLANHAREAYQRGDYAAAVREYQKVAPQCGDLATLAANQAAALYRLERFNDAEKRYRLAESGGANPQAARAAYDRGNCLLREACQDTKCPDSTKLEQAARHFRACLARDPETADAEDLFSDARHNLELTKLLRAPTPAGEQENGSAQRDAHPGDRPLSGGDDIKTDNRSNSGPSDTPSSPGAAPEKPRLRATLASFVARPDDDYLCPDCRRELEQASLNPDRSEDKPNRNPAEGANRDSRGEGSRNASPADGERKENESASAENQAGAPSRDAKPADATKEPRNAKKIERDKQAAEAGSDSGEWRDTPKQRQGKGPT